jgi:hypothetical protein
MRTILGIGFTTVAAISRCYIRVSGIVAVLILTSACGGSSLPTVPTDVPFAADQMPPNGRVTLVSITTVFTSCRPLTRQVNSSWNTWLDLRRDGDAIALSFWDDGPPGSSPSQDEPGVFMGVRTADAVFASYVGAWDPLRCEGGSYLLRSGGTLTATISGDQLAGGYTEVYGTDAEVTLTNHFEAHVWPTAAVAGIGMYSTAPTPAPSRSAGRMQLYVFYGPHSRQR